MLLRLFAFPLVNDANAKENMKHIDHDYAIEDKLLIISEDVDYKAKGKNIYTFLMIKLLKMAQ